MNDEAPRKLVRSVATSVVKLRRLGQLLSVTVNPKPEEKPPEPTPVANLKWTAEKPITDPEFDIRSLAISPDGKKFAVDVSNGINTAVFNVSIGTRRFVVRGRGARFIGKDIYTWAGSVNQFDADTGTKKKVSPPTGALFSTGAQISPNGKTIAGFDCMVMRLIDARIGSQYRTHLLLSRDILKAAVCSAAVNVAAPPKVSKKAMARAAGYTATTAGIRHRLAPDQAGPTAN